jgi:leucyl aminopeptidase
MPENNPNRITIILSTTEQKKPSLSLTFSPTPSKPELNLPGKSLGDILLIQREDNIQEAVISLGIKEEIIDDSYRKAGGLTSRWLLKSNAKSATIDLDQMNVAENSSALQALFEGLYLGAYSFDEHKTDSEPETIATIYLICSNENKKINKLLSKSQAATRAVFLARDLAHQPANFINPQTLAEKAQAVADENTLKCTVLDDKALRKISAGGILSVGQGSKTPSRMIILEYPGQGASIGKDPVVLVGKAITFDTGGYSLKDKNGILGMKYDKCGGVTVLAMLQAAAQLKLKTPLVGIICAAENMISNEAYRPDDIITTLSGKTVEIVSTDAEGRMVLIDGLTYAQEHYKPRALIDMATLTGGIVVALGRVRGGLMSNNDNLARKLLAAGETTHERFWRMPLDNEYFQLIKGDDADMKNSGAREAHPIIGGIFLKQAVDDEVPWAHLDIAGMATTDKDTPYSPKGATGFGIRLLIEYLEDED